MDEAVGVINRALETAPEGYKEYAIFTNCWTDKLDRLIPRGIPVAGSDKSVDWQKGMPRASLSVVWNSSVKLDCSCVDDKGVVHKHPCVELSLGSVSTVMPPECCSRESQCYKDWECGTGTCGGACGKCADMLVCIGHKCVPPPVVMPLDAGFEDVRTIR